MSLFNFTLWNKYFDGGGGGGGGGVSLCGCTERNGGQSFPFHVPHSKHL